MIRVTFNNEYPTTTLHSGLDEALASVRHLRPELIEFDASLRLFGESRKKITYDEQRGWFLYRGIRYQSLRTLIHRVPPDALFTRLRANYVDQEDNLIHIRLIDPIPADTLYGD